MCRSLCSLRIAKICGYGEVDLPKVLVDVGLLYPIDSNLGPSWLCTLLQVRPVGSTLVGEELNAVRLHESKMQQSDRRGGGVARDQGILDPKSRYRSCYETLSRFPCLLCTMNFSHSREHRILLVLYSRSI